MAIARVAGAEFTDVGSHLATIGAHSISTITIPTADIALFGFTFTGDGGATFTSPTLAGQSAHQIAIENTDTDDIFGALFAVLTPTPGINQTLSWTNVEDVSAMRVSLGFWTGVDISGGAAGAYRSSGSETGDTSATTATMTALSGDLGVGFLFTDGGTPSPTVGSIVVAHTGFPDFHIVEYAPSGNTTMGATGLVDGGILAAMLKPAGGGGGPSNQYVSMNPMRSYRKSGRFV